MVVVPARQATQPGGIGSLESILGLFRSLKIRALDFLSDVTTIQYNGVVGGEKG